MRKQVVLGVDPGIANTRLSVVCRSASYELLLSELVKSTPEMPKAERLLKIYKAVCRLIDLYQCDLVSIEKCFHNQNVSSSQSTGAVIGAVMIAAGREGIPVVEVTPQEVKSATGLGGKVDKKTVVKMMGKLLNQKKALSVHVADAAAVAIAGILQT